MPLPLIPLAIGGAALAGGLGSYFGGKAKSDAAAKNRQAQMDMYNQGRSDLEPWRDFGTSNLSGFQDWMGSEAGRAPIYGGDPTMEDVMGSAGYDTRLGAVENSAAARGGLFSGNALRDIGEFGASEFDRARDRGIQDYGMAMNAYESDYARRKGLLDMGYNAAAGTAGMAAGMAPSIGATYDTQGNAMADMYGGIASNIGSAAGAYAGYKKPR